MKPITRLRIALRHVAASPVQNFFIAAAVAFASATALALFLFAQGLMQGTTRAVEPFELLVGARGSPYQLVLSTVFLQDAPTGNIPWRTLASLSEDPRIRHAVPVGLGDTYRNCAVVGTTRDIMEVRVRPSDPPWFRVGKGRMFENAFEAVLGADAAAQTGLGVGSTFRTSHGAVGGAEHEESYTVVGIADTLRGPWDRAVFVNLESVWESHRHGAAGHAEGEKAKRRKATSPRFCFIPRLMPPPTPWPRIFSITPKNSWSSRLKPRCVFSP